MKLRLNKYFIEQSINHPYWWRNYKWWGYCNNKKNYIYLLYWWAFKERHEMETAVFCNIDGSFSYSELLVDIKLKDKQWIIPLYKRPICYLFNLLKIC